MAPAQNRLLGVLFVSGLLSGGLGACSSDSDNGSGSTGGSGGSGSGSVSSAGGGSSSVASSSNAGSSGGGQSSSSSSSKGGASGGASSSQPASSGGVATGGSSSSEAASSGGTTSSGTGTGTGTGTGGKGGSTGTGTGTGTGGKGGGTGTGTGTGGKGGGTGTGTGGTSAAGGTSAGGTAAGGCQKGGFKGSELVIFGESFYDWNPPHIKNRLEELARKAGSLGASDSYRQVAKAGQPMSYIANEEYKAATSGGKFTKVVMDGGGIDCMTSSCSTCPDTFKGLLDKFVTQGVDQVVYTRYPEPGNPPGSDANLKKNLDALMPRMETVCKGYTGLKCYWVNLVPVWPAEKDKYTTDGLHPTKTGGDVVGDAIWAEMVKQCMAQ
jgi:hypothetical protein